MRHTAALEETPAFVWLQYDVKKRNRCSQTPSSVIDIKYVSTASNRKPSNVQVGGEARMVKPERAVKRNPQC